MQCSSQIVFLVRPRRHDLLTAAPVSGRVRGSRWLDWEKLLTSGADYYGAEGRQAFKGFTRESTPPIPGT